MKAFARITIALTVLLALAGIAGAQSWTTLTNQPKDSTGNLIATGPMLQLRDGRILVNESQGPDAGVWVILTPNATGNYVNGIWSVTGHLPQGYAPIYFGSQVLLDGKHVAIEGGEYNNGSAVWTTLGAVGTITPFGNVSWLLNAPPTGWGTIGDAQSITLASKQYMQANCCTPQNAIYVSPNIWLETAGMSVSQASNDESGFTLLTNNKVLTVDAKNSTCGDAVHGGAELYTVSNTATGVGTWSCTGQTPIHLYNPVDEELGAAVMMYNNKVFQSGGNVVATAVYDVASGTWAAGPTPPNGLDQADGPAALLPNGNVLVDYSPGLFANGCQFMEYDPSVGTVGALNFAPNGLGCPSGSSFLGHLMILPTGQVMFTDFGNSPVAVYNPAPGVVATAVPTILAASTSLSRSTINNILYGKQLNGLSQNNAYGDDYSGDTNYPLVRLTCLGGGNCTVGNVYYAFTHDDSTHSIAPGTIMFTHFDLPPTIPLGKYSLQSVANGIGSNSIVVTVGP